MDRYAYWGKNVYWVLSACCYIHLSRNGCFSVLQVMKGASSLGMRPPEVITGSK